MILEKEVMRNIKVKNINFLNYLNFFDMKVGLYIIIIRHKKIISSFLNFEILINFKNF